MKRGHGMFTLIFKKQRRPSSSLNLVKTVEEGIASDSLIPEID